MKNSSSPVYYTGCVFSKRGSLLGRVGARIFCAFSAEEVRGIRNISPAENNKVYIYIYIYRSLIAVWIGDFANWILR